MHLLNDYCEVILVGETYYTSGISETNVSEFAFFRFLSHDLLTKEEREHKSEIISVTEQALDEEGIECDAKIAKLPEEKIVKILSEVRKRRRKILQSENGEEAVEEVQKEEDPVSAR